MKFVVKLIFLVLAACASDDSVHNNLSASTREETSEVATKIEEVEVVANLKSNEFIFTGARSLSEQSVKNIFQKLRVSSVKDLGAGKYLIVFRENTDIEKLEKTLRDQKISGWVQENVQYQLNPPGKGSKKSSDQLQK